MNDYVFAFNEFTHSNQSDSWKGTLLFFMTFSLSLCTHTHSHTHTHTHTHYFLHKLLILNFHAAFGYFAQSFSYPPIDPFWEILNIQYFNVNLLLILEVNGSARKV